MAAAGLRAAPLRRPAAAARAAERWASAEAVPSAPLTELLEALNAHAEAGNLAGARQVFDDLRTGSDLESHSHGTRRTAWNTLLKAHANAGDCEGAEAVYAAMHSAQVRANDRSFGKLIETAAKAGRPRLAEKWFDRLLEEPGPVVYGMMIDACAKAGEPSRAASWLDAMLSKRVAPHLAGYTALIDACAKVADPSGAAHWFGKLVSARLQPNALSLTAVIDSYSKAGDVAGATMWLERMSVLELPPDRVAFTALVDSCARLGDARGASRWLERMMLSQLVPDEISYNAAIDGHTFHGKEFCSILCEVTRQDRREQLRDGALLVHRALNSLVVIRRRPGGVPWPANGLLFRGAGIPRTQLHFWRSMLRQPPSKYRAPMPLATSSERRVAERFLRNVPSGRGLEATLFELVLQRNLNPPCMHANYLEGASSVRGEEEFLFAAYSAFKVLQVKLQPEGAASANAPSVVVLEVCQDNSLEELGLPRAPWH